MRTDVRFALRTLGRAPGFTAVAVLSLALGIGANTAIFSLLDQVLLRPLPVNRANALVYLTIPDPLPGASTSDYPGTVFSYPTYRELRDRSAASFSDVLGRASSTVAFQHTGAAERARAEMVTGNFFTALGVRPKLGRTLAPEDDLRPGAHPVAVLSHSFWVRRFGGSAGILNQTVRVNGHPMTVVGVLPEGFNGVLASQIPDLFVPTMMKRHLTPGSDDLDKPDRAWLTVFGLLKPGVSRQQAEAAMAPVFRNILEQSFAKNAGTGAARDRFLAMKLTLEPAAQGLSNMRRQWRTPLLALAAIVGLVLLIACANVANLMITRAASRSKEMAVRASLGAGRLALARQLLTESAMLAFAGGAVGVLISAWVVDMLLKLMPTGSGPRVLDFHLDARLLGFTLLLSLVTALFFGMLPAWQANRTDLATVLKAQATSVASGSAQARIRRFMVTGQVAMALMLLIASGLFLKSLGNLMSVDPGFRADNLLTFVLNPRLSGYDPKRAVALYRNLETQLASQPGVVAVAAANPGPFTQSHRGTNITAEGYRAKEDEDTGVSVHSISAGYFQAIGVSLVLGREFSDRDLAGAPKVVIVNEEFVKKFFAGQNPVGRKMTFGAGDVTLDHEIVGVARNSKHSDLKQGTVKRAVYVPYMQEENIGAIDFYVRTSKDEAAASSAVRSAVASLDSGLPVYSFKMVRTQIADSVYTERLLATLSAAFGFLATFLAAIGVYGVIAYNVARRTNEIGIRVALGAERGDVLRLVLREVFAMAAAGVALGIVGALIAGRFVESQLYGIAASDPLVVVVASVTLAGAALLAAWIPARRATRIDPMRALRYE